MIGDHIISSENVIIRELYGDRPCDFNDEWLQADDASALRRHVATQEQKDRADAAVKRAPALLDRYSAGMDAGQRAALKAYLITLDLRDEALEASEAALRAKAEEIRPAAINL